MWPYKHYKNEWLHVLSVPWPITYNSWFCIYSDLFYGGEGCGLCQHKTNVGMKTKLDCFHNNQQSDPPVFPTGLCKTCGGRWRHILICIFTTSLRQVCFQTSFGNSDLFYSMNGHIIQYNWLPNKAVHIIFSVAIHKTSINSTTH